MFRRETFLLSTAALVGAVLGAHPLYDPDLGWNLVGGFYLLDNLRFPLVDSIAVGRAKWVNYGWLPQLLFALVERGSGFTGLCFLQSFLSALLFVAGVSLCVRCPYRAGAMMLFLAPICHLRPQLVSVLLFILFLHWRKGSRKLLPLCLLCVAWSNTHVYWIFAPVILWSDWIAGSIRARISKPETALLRSALHLPILATLAGVISPYGIENLHVVIEYAFFHSHATPLIREFQSLYQVKGYLFPLALGVVAWLVLYSKGERVLGSGLFFLSLSQMKFTPLFGVFSLSDRESTPRVFPFPILVSVLGAFLILPFTDTLRESERELVQLGQTLREERVVGNLFDEGGWLAYALYGSAAKILIDGRTLVMGKDRLQHYAAVMRGNESACAWFKDAEVIVLRREGKIIGRLSSEECSFEIGNEGGRTFGVFRRSRPVRPGSS